MKCDNCSRSATVHLTKLEDGAVKDVYLCDECAGEHHDLSDPFSLHSLLSGIANMGKMPFPVPRTEVPDLHCGTCGMGYREFRNTGRFGCADCYATFSPHLPDLLKNIHGSCGHAGKKPMVIVPLQSAVLPEQKEILALESVDSMREELKRAIEAENFEKAAVLRDKIRERENYDAE